MLVKCINAKYQENPKSLRFGNVYIVLSFRLIIGKQNEYCKVCVQNDDDDYPCVFDFSNFEIIDERIPDDWIIAYVNSGFYLIPKAFDGDFWERFHDSDKWAEQTFERVMEDLKEFHGLSTPKAIEYVDPYSWPFEEYK